MPISCSADERRRGVVSAIVSDCGGQERPCSDATKVVEFYPDKETLPEEVLKCVQEAIGRRCWCQKFGPVRSDNTIGELQERVRRQHIRQGGPIKQPKSPDECCN
jgi:hypothetical protein